jgi:hypothetical protein
MEFIAAGKWSLRFVMINFHQADDSGRDYIGDVVEEPPYRGAKPCFLISGEKLEDRAWLSELIRITTEELPTPVKTKKTTRKIA